MSRIKRSKAELMRLRWEKRLTLAEIAQLWGCSTANVSNVLKSHGIPEAPSGVKPYTDQRPRRVGCYLVNGKEIMNLAKFCREHRLNECAVRSALSKGRAYKKRWFEIRRKEPQS